MTRSATIRENIGAKFDEVQAILAVAEEEGKELTATQKSQVDSIMAEIGEERGDDGKPTGMWADVKREERIEAHQERLAAQRQGNTNNSPDASGRSFEIPRAAMRSNRSLKAFSGDGGEYEAYACGQFILSMIGNSKAKQWCQDHGIHGALSTGDNQLGGFLVPSEFESRVIDLREQYGVFRANTMVVPMASDHQVQPRRKSGLTAYAVTDNQEVTASDKEWSQVELIAKKWGALSKYSSEIAEDAVISLADNLADEMAYAFSLKEDQTGFVGDGTSTYHGIEGAVSAINDGSHDGSVYTAATGNTAFSTLDLADFEGCVGQLPQYAENGAAWYISKVGYWASMARLLDAVGGNTIQDLGRGPELVFLGYPVRISQVLNSNTGAQNSTTKCLFGNLAMASTLGDRRGFSVRVSSDRYFELDQLGIIGTTRTAINVHELGDATNAGPLIALETAAS